MSKKRRSMMIADSIDSMYLEVERIETCQNTINKNRLKFHTGRGQIPNSVVREPPSRVKFDI